MSSQDTKVHRLSLAHYTAFQKVSFDFCSGLNVLIGTNSTGKTLTLKMMYALLKAHQHYYESRKHPIPQNDPLAPLFLPSFSRIFQVQNEKELIHIGSSSMSAKLEFAKTSYEITIEDMKPGLSFEPRPGNRSETVSLSPLYIPPQEMLSINQGFISLYQKREIPYDETYYDLSLALNALPLRREKLGDIQEILDFLRNILRGGHDSSDTEIITQSDNRFYFNLAEGRLETHLVAEGYRKIATLLYLLKNGSLTRNSILFWDEPEANLNPKLTVQLVEILKKLCSAGMQIFITTHDYLLAHELSFLPEYQKNSGVELKIFSLYKETEDSGVQVESAQTLAEISHNAILEEFAAHYDRESAFFQK